MALDEGNAIDVFLPDLFKGFGVTRGNHHPGKSHAFGLPHPLLHVGNPPNFPQEPNLSDEGRVGANGDLEERPNEREGHGKVGRAAPARGLGETNSADDVEVDVLVPKGKVAFLLEDGEDEEEPGDGNAIDGSSGGLVGGGDEGLYFGGDGTRSLKGEGDGASVGFPRGVAVGEEEGGWIGYGEEFSRSLGMRWGGHLEDSDFVRGSESVFGCAQHSDVLGGGEMRF